MQQVWIPRYGGPEVLEVRQAPDPEPQEGQVRIRVGAAGINFADVVARVGLYLDAPGAPMVVGYEVAGTVDAVGRGVAIPAGTRVVGLTRFGGHSDVVCVPAAQVRPLPSRLSFEQGAAIPVNYLTAWLMLIRLGNVQRGERVLVHAGAGGVGLAALQLAKWRGAEVIATASAGKHDRLRSLGVAHCIDYHSQDFEDEVHKITDGKGVHVVLDAVGGKSFKKSYRCLAPMGRLFLFGVSGMIKGHKRSIPAVVRTVLAMPKFKAIPLMNDNRGVFGINLGHLWEQIDVLGKGLEELLALAEQSMVDPIVDKTFPFSKAADAHAYIQAHKNFGKVVLTPG